MKKNSSKQINSEKLQKILAREGLASRREIERWIADGRIKLNGKLATLGDRASLTDKITVDGNPVNISTDVTTRVLLYHKPEGEICTRNDPEGRPTVFAKLPVLHDGRWISIGRLDINTCGILLFTNDGDLANKQMHPSSEIEREYACRVNGEISPASLSRLRKGVKLEDGMGKFDMIEKSGGEGKNQWYHVIVKAGRNRLVRRLWESQNISVSRLIRVRYGIIVLPRSLKSGEWKEISASDLF